MSTYEIRDHCGQCDGDGQVTIWKNDIEQGTETCPQCGGSGKRLVGELNLDVLEAKIDAIKAKVDLIYDTLPEGWK